MAFDLLAARALDTASKWGADYADIRFELARGEHVEVRNGIVTGLSDATSCGYGIRALVGGSWGFAASSQLDDAALDATAARAIEIAKAGATIARRGFGSIPP